MASMDIAGCVDQLGPGQSSVSSVRIAENAFNCNASLVIVHMGRNTFSLDVQQRTK